MFGALAGKWDLAVPHCPQLVDAISFHQKRDFKKKFLVKQECVMSTGANLNGWCRGVFPMHRQGEIATVISCRWLIIK